MLLQLIQLLIAIMLPAHAPTLKVSWMLCRPNSASLRQRSSPEPASCLMKPFQLTYANKCTEVTCAASHMFDPLVCAC